MFSVDQLSDALLEKIATREIVQRLDRISGTDVTVLLQGEDGTGKGLVAEAIHRNSARRSARFAVVNCNASNETALESQLFGHVRGAFADALTERVGSFEHAHGGTLLLNDIGDMPLPTQGKLLQALENGEIIRLGSNDAIKINVRVIAATNRGLERDVEAGTFRSDLYHALRVVVIRLPALVGRSADIGDLINDSIKFYGHKYNKQIRGPSSAAMQKMLSHNWPGNTRELRRIVEGMVVVDSDGVLDVDDLPDELADRNEPASEPPTASLTNLVGKPLDELERLFIAETLRVAGGNREEAAKMLGIGERTLYRKIKEYAL